MLNPMYPDEVDRHRIFGILFTTQTKMKNIQPKNLKELLEVSQSTISNIGRLGDVERELKPGRDLIIRALTEGLELSQEIRDTLLWLYDRRPKGINREGPKNEIKYDEKTLRAKVLELLSDALSYRSKKSKKDDKKELKKVDVEVVFNPKEYVHVGALKEMLKIERKPGQRLLVSNSPSSLTHRPGTYLTRIDPGNLLAPKIAEEWRTVMEERSALFRENLQCYGERHIYSLDGLRAYLTENPGHQTMASLEQRKEQVKHLIELLVGCKYYEVGLVDEVPELDVEIKSTKAVILRGAPRKEHWRMIWGPRYVFWRDEDSALSFLLDFERHWDSIQEKNGTKSSVIKKLQQLLKEC